MIDLGKLRLFIIAIALGGLAAYLSVLCHCAGPTPVPDPPPQPTPADPFAGAIVDCSTAEVQGQSPQATGGVAFCLISETTSSCLVSLLASYRVDTVACVVRQAGIDANVHVLAGNPTGNDTTIDNAARAFIVDHRIGYR